MIGIVVMFILVLIVVIVVVVVVAIIVVIIVVIIFTVTAAIGVVIIVFVVMIIGYGPGVPRSAGPTPRHRTALRRPVARQQAKPSEPKIKDPVFCHGTQYRV